MNIIDKPVSLKTEQYDELFEKIKNHFVKAGNIINIHRFGSVSNPGISDLDIMIIVKDGYSLDFNDYNILKKDKLILTHSPFIISEKYLPKARSISPYFDGFNNLDSIIKKQIAIAFLIKFFISLTIQINLKTIKLRNILLELKAAKEDFIVLDNYEQVKEFIKYFMEIRENYFNLNLDKKIFIERVISFYYKLKQILTHISDESQFSSSKEDSYNLIRNFNLRRNNVFDVSIQGIFPFTKSIIINRKTFNLINGFYRYKMTMNWQYYDDNQVLNNMYILEKEIYKYHQKHFVNYICPISPLII